MANPSVFTIGPAEAFADAFVSGIVKRFGQDPLALSSITILLPNRRSVRSIREAFLRHLDGRPQLLPSMRAIGDIDEGEVELLGAGFGLDLSALTPPISPLRRQALLTKLVSGWHRPHRSAEALAPAQAWRLAGELATFLDEVGTMGLSFRALEDLAPDALAEHWRETLDFLTIITAHWPEIMAEEGGQDPASYRDQSLRRLAALYREQQPGNPIIAAGSTGSVPATAALLGVIARLPQGMVVLPGLEVETDDETWALLEDTHPQASMKTLLEAISVSRHEVEEWHEEAEASYSFRLDFMRDALLPSERTEQWRSMDYASASEDRIFAGMNAVVAPTRREEAETIAVLMREVLETPSKSAALVTPDRQLALYVRAALHRWGIDIDDSGGDKAINSVPGRLLGLIATAASLEFGPLSVLALLQHPLVSCGMARSDYLRIVRRADQFVLRGVRPAGGLKGIKARAAASASDAKSPYSDEDQAAFEQILSFLEPLEAALASKLPLSDVLEAHISVAEQLCAGKEENGAERLWQGEAGSVLSNHIADLLFEAGGLEVGDQAGYGAFFSEVMNGVTIRPAWNRHPRLAIWGPLEARLQRADLMILGGLNEGVWPAEPGTDPWMSKAMRTQFGLPPIERKIGQSAHDFMLAASGPSVVLTRAEKTDGAPTIPSRWWFRLEALAGRPIPQLDSVQHWAGELVNASRDAPLAPPAPRPPVAARPKQLSVTQVQELMRDPFAVYARKVLGLSKLDPIEDKPNAAQKGTLLHDALERFLKDEGPRFGPDGYKRLIEVGRATFEPVISQPAVYAFWWPRFERIAQWFVENEEERANSFRPVVVEGWARREIAVPGSEDGFTLIAKADRIDASLATGELVIIDYKTGETPSALQVEAGYAPQLPLEGWLASLGAFEGVAASNVADLVFWKLSGGDPVQEQKRPIKDVEAAIEDAADGLQRLVAAFNDPDTAYLSNPRPSIAGYGDFDHFARVKEWRNSAGPTDNGQEG